MATARLRLVGLGILLVGAGVLSAAPVGASTIEGTEGPDYLVGTPDGDFIDGRAGDDQIWARQGRDGVRSGAGNDVVHMGGNPSARGHPELAYGGPGTDKLYGNRNFDQMYGGGGDDRIHGGRAVDNLKGGPGQDRVIGGWARDLLDGGPGKDVILGGAGPDQWLDFGTDTGADRVLLGTGRDLAAVTNDGAPDLIDCGPGQDHVWAETDPLDEFVRCEFFDPLFRP